MPVSFEEFEERKVNDHRERMIETTREDARIHKEIPYFDNIPAACIGVSRRKCQDLMELNA
jgi:hypothetical protein